MRRLALLSLLLGALIVAGLLASPRPVEEDRVALNLNTMVGQTVKWMLIGDPEEVEEQPEVSEAVYVPVELEVYPPEA